VRESGRGKLPMCFGGGLAEEGYQCGAVCALRVREAASLSLEKEDSMYQTWMLEWRRN